MAQNVRTPDIEFTSALLTRVLSHLVGTLTNTSGIPEITGLSRRLLRDWCDGVVPGTAVTPLSLQLVEAAIDIVTMSHPLTQANSTQRYAWRFATDLHHAPTHFVA
ncbi:MAG: hypothetical protein LC793_14065 [Thermomicrobia bacterium]|nr:hypothetical protein [Thermomicrobia bacterium]